MLNINFSTEQWDFIDNHADEDVNRLRLSARGDALTGFMIDQIECRKRTAKKLAATLKSIPRFIFPSVLSAEQSTSDSLASFHASLIPDGVSLLDMTCGLGIDAFHCAEKAASVDAYEINELNASCTAHNAAIADKCNITVHCDDSVAKLSSLDNDSYGCIFIDPARRGDFGKRLYALSDCAPDVTALLPRMLATAPKVIVKASPMLDMSNTELETSGHAESIIAVGDRRECKELVICLGRETTNAPLLRAVTVIDGNAISDLTFTKEEERDSQPEYDCPEAGEFLYEPYPAVLKAAPFKLLSLRYGIAKLAPNSHLYTSPTRVDDFPGRVFKIMDVTSLGKKQIKEIAGKYTELNVTTRNFPMKPEEVSKKLKVKQGGSHRLFATRDYRNRPILIITSALDKDLTV